MTRGTSGNGDSRLEALEALVRARQEKKNVEDQRPLIETEARTVGFLLQQNNLGPRFRKAMRLRFGGQ